MPEQRRGLGKFLERQGTARPSTSASPAATTADAPKADAEASAPGRRAGPRAGRRATKDGREQLLVYLRPEGIKELKLAALNAETTASAIIAEALNTWLQRHGRPPVA